MVTAAVKDSDGDCGDGRSWWLVNFGCSEGSSDVVVRCLKDWELKVNV